MKKRYLVRKRPARRRPRVVKPVRRRRVPVPLLNRLLYSRVPSREFRDFGWGLQIGCLVGGLLRSNWWLVLMGAFGIVVLVLLTPTRSEDEQDEQDG